MESVTWSGTLFCAVGAGGHCATFEETVVASLDSDTSALTSWEPDGLENDEDYTVRVKHHTATLNSEWSDLRRFRTEADLTGVIWTYQPSLRTAVSMSTMYSVAWSGTQFVAVGAKGKSATSPDGVAWRFQSSLAAAVANSDMHSVVWTGTQFCAVGKNGKCATSPDGVTWTNQPSFTSAVGGNSVYSVGWGGSQFCAVGYRGKCATS